MLKYNSKLKLLARQLRNDMTVEERKLWYEYLRNCGARFLRQKIIGNYIVDFYCPSKNIVIEIDGGQHFEPDALEKDKVRDEYLKMLGLIVLRYNNLEIRNHFEGVCLDIENNIKNPP